MPYGIAKKALLVQGQAYRKQYGFNVIHLLPVNLYGPGDNFDLNTSHVIPALIRKFVEAKEQNLSELKLWGSGNPSREFLYVEDAAEAIIKATELYNEAEPINIGTGLEVSIKQLAYMISERVGFKGVVGWDNTKPDGQPRRCLNVEKAKKKFDFKSKTSLAVGLDKTIRWFTLDRKAHNG